jgi:hypothetical protein
MVPLGLRKIDGRRQRPRQRLAEKAARMTNPASHPDCDGPQRPQRKRLLRSTMVAVSGMPRRASSSKVMVPACQQWRALQQTGTLRDRSAHRATRQVDYLRKIPALFAEFRETGTSRNLGYDSPPETTRRD